MIWIITALMLDSTFYIEIVLISAEVYDYDLMNVYLYIYGVNTNRYYGFLIL